MLGNMISLDTFDQNFPNPAISVTRAVGELGHGARDVAASSRNLCGRAAKSSFHSSSSHSFHQSVAQAWSFLRASIMGLEDFERELAEQRSVAHKRKRERSRSPHREGQRRHHHRHHNRKSHSSRHAHENNEQQEERHRLRHNHRHEDESMGNRQVSHEVEPNKPRDADPQRSYNESIGTSATGSTLHASSQQRDSWMQAPSALHIDYVHRREMAPAPSQFTRATEKDYTIPLHQNEIADETFIDNHAHSQSAQKDALPELDYTFGDAGSSWRMTKLRATRQIAEEAGRTVEEVAVERYGNLRAFDDAREEEIELDRRERYGKAYMGKDIPTGELFKLRKPASSGIQQEQFTDIKHEQDEHHEISAQQNTVSSRTSPLDPTSLNKLKAKMLKAKLRRASDAEQLELEYREAMAHSAGGKPPNTAVTVLSKMDSRMLVGDRTGEIKSIQNKRGRERQLVEENEDMSIEDMVRNERRTRGQFGGEGKAFAERIAKDAKFDNDLDYMDENAAKLAKTAQKSEINLRNTAIGDYQKMQRILDNCPLCHHEESGKAPQAPIVSLATRTFLTLPTSPEITPYGRCATIVPTQHRLSLLECDDDEWEEIRNFMKSLTRFYWSQTPRLSVIFYENAAHAGRKRHASMEAVPLPADVAANASAYFKEAILTSDEEWTQHKKIIDTLAAAKEGVGKLAFRRSMVSNLPYFHVWFSLDGGIGHVVEDSRRWPKGDLFAREVIGGILDVGLEVIKKQGMWTSGDLDMQRRVKEFRKGWEKWDWTQALVGDT